MTAVVPVKKTLKPRRVKALLKSSQPVAVRLMIAIEDRNKRGVELCDKPVNFFAPWIHASKRQGSQLAVVSSCEQLSQTVKRSVACVLKQQININLTRVFLLK